MKVLIVEDERLAADNLVKILNKIGNLKILGVLESIYEVLEWFQMNEIPELMFLDIHLADGSAFDIFGKQEINCPIIFTTAYDEYALKAFRVNSIAYLLKPLVYNDVVESLDKLKRLTSSAENKPHEISELLQYFKNQATFKSSFLIPAKGDKLIPLKTDEIEYFYIEHGIVKAITSEEVSFFIDKTLDEILEEIDPKLFFRANRQYIISRRSVKDIDLWFNQRLSVNLRVSTPDKIIISKARINDFKKWFEI